MTRKQRKPGRLRSPDGHITEYPDTPTLQEWIVEGRVNRKDQIYDGRKRGWRLVEEVPELFAFIQLREANAPWEQAHSRYLAGLGS